MVGLAYKRSQRNDCKRISSATIIPSGGRHGVKAGTVFRRRVSESFRVCGIAAEGEKVPENKLNERLKQLLVVPENAGMVLSTEEASAEKIIEVESHNESNEEDELDFIQIGASDIMGGLDVDDYDNSDE